jgi:hypothetical protein
MPITGSAKKAKATFFRAPAEGVGKTVIDF